MVDAGIASTRIPLSIPSITDHERTRVMECLESGWVSTAGPQIGELEERISTLLGVEHAVAVVSGTAALHLALLGAGADAHSEVVLASLTFVATANAVSYCGATPVFADVRPASATLDAGGVDRLVRSRYRPERGQLVEPRTGRRLAAVIATDLFGHPADGSALRALTDGWGVPLVEDAAEALGASSRGIPAGALGDVAVLSFNGNKVITAGGGGMLVTSDAETAHRARHLATQARTHAIEYLHDAVGFNYRMPSLNAALALAQLERLGELVAARQANRARYAERLGEQIMGEESWASSSFWLTSLLLDRPQSRGDLLGIVAACARDGVDVRPFFAPVHDLAPYAGAPRGPLAVSADLYARGLSLPSSFGLSAEDVDRVCAALRRATGI